MANSIVDVYRDKTDEQKEQYLNYMNRKIKTNSNTGYNALIRKMMNIVEKSLTRNYADFYVYDLEFMRLTEGSPVLWIVRECGTQMIDLHSEDFSQDQRGNLVWVPVAHFRSVLFNFRDIKEIYLIENEKLIKVNIKSAFATLAVKEEYMKSLLINEGAG